MNQASPQFDPSTALTVGRILAPHGVKGEVKVEPLTGFPERFESGSVLWLTGSPIRVQRSRWQGRALYVTFEGIESRTQAEALRGAELQASPGLVALPQDTYYRDDLIGLQVIDETGQHLGEIREIFSTGSNDVYVVRGARGELLLPALHDVIREIDLGQGHVRVELIEGLEWVHQSSKPPVAGSRQRKQRATRN